MITLRRTQTQEEIKRFSDTFHMLTVKTADGMMLRLTLEDGSVVEGYVLRMHMDASHHGHYFGHVELVTEENTLYMIDLLDIKGVENITTKDLLRKYADKKIITVSDRVKEW
jgi:hypothetical protein